MSPRPLRRQFGDGIPKPKSIKEIPAYLVKVTKGFISRLFYIVKLVWKAAPPVLIIMALLCLLDGVLPVIGAYISKDLLVIRGKISLNFNATAVKAWHVVF